MSDSFVLELLLKTLPEHERILNICLEAGRHLYNGCLGEALKRLDLARMCDEWKEAKQLELSAKRSQLFRQALKKNRFSEYELHTFVKKLIKESWLGDHIDSQVAQKVASRAFQAVEAHARNKRGRPRFKGSGQFCSLEGKSNVTGIRFKNGKIVWKDLVLEPKYDLKDKKKMQAHALGHKTKYVRLVRRIIQGHPRFYAQLVQEGKPLVKKDLTKETVGLDIGPSTIAIVSSKNARLSLLSECMDQDVKKLERALDRSRRANNPDNFDGKGVALKGKKWSYSHRYKKKKSQLAEEKRKMSAKRKTSHGTLANQILSMGTTIKTEKLDYKEFQKEYGKSIGRHAPGMLMQILRRKAANAGGQVIEFSTYRTKLSQTCHACGSKTKKSLQERWHYCPCGLKGIQRDLYSAFLALHVNDEKLNRTQAKKAWASGGPLLEQALLRCKETAKGKQRVASFGLSQRQSCLSVEDESTGIEVKSKTFEELSCLVIRTPLL